jgi:arylsulfatase A-like enzyme
MKQNRANPFSMVVGFKTPHGPRGGANLPERLRTLYAGEKSRPVPNLAVRAIYQAPGAAGTPGAAADVIGVTPAAQAAHLDYFRHITGADENLGKLLAALDELGLADDTVVVYSSDNGYYLGEHGLGDKRSLYEESLRVPMLVRYPRLFAKGAVRDEMVLNIDLAPTFLDLAGVPAPREMQGASWKPIAAGQKPAGWRTSFLAEYFLEGAYPTPTMVGVRTANSKIVKYPAHPEWTEVFDLAVDPYELNNLASNPAATAKLSAELDAQIKATNYAEPPGMDKPGQPAAKAKKKAKTQ